eukprot:1154321-Pelagomonas_calceolata.AAC.3
MPQDSYGSLIRLQHTPWKATCRTCWDCRTFKVTQPYRYWTGSPFLLQARPYVLLLISSIEHLPLQRAPTSSRRADPALIGFHTTVPYLGMKLKNQKEAPQRTHLVMVRPSFRPPFSTGGQRLSCVSLSHVAPTV